MACNSSKWLSSPIRGLVLDITGVLKDSDIPIKGSVEAIKLLEDAGIPFCLASNETTLSVCELSDKLQRMGYRIPVSRIITPLPVMVDVLKKRNLRPHLLVGEELAEAFDGIDQSNPNCVVMGDVGHGFTYSNLNTCFQKLLGMDNPVLFSLGMGKYYKEPDGLCLDVGPFAKGLEYATGVQVETIGKPDPNFFLTAVKILGLEPHEVVMIGDDIEGDVGGAQKSGMRGVLVRTGKFTPKDECHPSVTPDAVVDNLLEAVRLIVQTRKTSF